MGNKCTRSKGSTVWHGDDDVLTRLKNFTPVNDANHTPIVSHQRGIIDLLDNELQNPTRNIHLKIDHVGGNRDVAKLPSSVYIFKVMLIFLSITPESELTLLTSASLDKKKVARYLYDMLNEVIKDNDRLKAILVLRCEGTAVWMNVLAKKENLNLPEYYTVKLIPSFRCSRQGKFEFFTPSKQGFGWKRSYAVEERTLLENKKGYKNYHKVIYILKMLFANEKVLTPMKSIVHTAIEARFKTGQPNWYKDTGLTHCVMDVLKSCGQSLAGGRLAHHTSGKNILNDYSKSHRDKLIGRLERLIFNKTEFMVGLESAKNFHKDQRQGNCSWTWMIAAIMILTILATTLSQDWIPKSMDQVCSPEGRLQRRLPWICSSDHQEPEQSTGWTTQQVMRALASGKYQVEQACIGDSKSAKHCIATLNTVIKKLEAVDEMDFNTANGNPNEDACPECKGDVALWDMLNLLLVIYVTFVLVVVLVWMIVSDIRRDVQQF